jgi:hypothetical protein
MDEMMEQIADITQEIKMQREQEDEGEYQRFNQLCPSHFAWM